MTDRDTSSGVFADDKSQQRATLCSVMIDMGCFPVNVAVLI